MPMKSCIYEGWIRHRRLRPKINAFRYSLFFMYLDLAELDTVFQGRWLWSVHKCNIACLLRKDHLGDPSVSLDHTIRDLVEQKTGKRPSGAIHMLAHLRYFGHNFNPASFYYCYDEAGTHVETVIVEIHNTPWGEVFSYVLDEEENTGTISEKSFSFSKAFHISPFMDMDMHYNWKFTEPSESLKVHMVSLEKEKEFFHAELTLERRELNGKNLARVLVQYPLMTVKVIAAIYWQALKLRIKGVPFYTHPEKRNQEMTGK